MKARVQGYPRYYHMWAHLHIGAVCKSTSYDTTVKREYVLGGSSSAFESDSSTFQTIVEHTYGMTRTSRPALEGRVPGTRWCGAGFQCHRLHMTDIQVFKVHLKRNRQINHFYLHILLSTSEVQVLLPSFPSYNGRMGSGMIICVVQVAQPTCPLSTHAIR